LCGAVAITLRRRSRVSESSFASIPEDPPNFTFRFAGAEASGQELVMREVFVDFAARDESEDRA